MCRGRGEEQTVHADARLQRLGEAVQFQRESPVGQLRIRGHFGADYRLPYPGFSERTRLRVPGNLGMSLFIDLVGVLP